ncbi:amidohydrolase [bacterium]|nr:amidohydrolase [bacterium]
MKKLTALRRELHTLAELSHHEARTSNRIRDWLKATSPDELIEQLGGHGVAAIYRGRQDGPRVLLRCDLDALPIPETIDIPHASLTPGVAHKCGHDGHMTIACGLAEKLSQHRPDSGTVILLFQPAEETGEGASLVLEDSKFESLQPDLVFALHNLPGFPLKQIVVREGTFAAASVGWTAHLTGATSHAAEPQAGRSPTLALSNLLSSLSAIPQQYTALQDHAKVTVIHARLGEQAFGTSPGEAVIMATIRAYSDATLRRLTARCTELAQKTAAVYDLQCGVGTSQEFPATVNHPDAVRIIQHAAAQSGLVTATPDYPFAWSEDFGCFTARYKGAMFGIGAGEQHPPLHHPDYEFPDELIEPGIEIFRQIIRQSTQNKLRNSK